LYDDDPKTSHLRIYSIAENKFIYEKLGAGFKNFNIYDNYVVYDTGFGLKSFISIIDLRSGNEIGRVNVQGGCGLRFIPLIPDYEA
jgi:hypothetical protein